MSWSNYGNETPKKKRFVRTIGDKFNIFYSYTAKIQSIAHHFPLLSPIIWRTRQMGKNFSFWCFQVCLDPICNMRSTKVRFQNHCLLLLRLFIYQCSAQTYQLCSIQIPCDCFTRFQQLIKHDAKLIAPNTPHEYSAWPWKHNRELSMISAHFYSLLLN